MYTGSGILCTTSQARKRQGYRQCAARDAYVSSSEATSDRGAAGEWGDYGNTEKGTCTRHGRRVAILSSGASGQSEIEGVYETISSFRVLGAFQHEYMPVYSPLYARYIAYTPKCIHIMRPVYSTCPSRFSCRQRCDRTQPRPGTPYSTLFLVPNCMVEKCGRGLDFTAYQGLPCLRFILCYGIIIIYYRYDY